MLRRQHNWLKWAFTRTLSLTVKGKKHQIRLGRERRLFSTANQKTWKSESLGETYLDHILDPGGSLCAHTSGRGEPIMGFDILDLLEIRIDVAKRKLLRPIKHIRAFWWTKKRKLEKT